jgi:hypothetical protein
MSRHHAKHRKPSRAPQVALTTLTTALVLGEVAATGSTAYAADGDDFARLRRCESGGNYGTNTGNGYYGAYQFDLRTWHGMGYAGRPSDASPATQDQAAARLQAARGWSPWPACARSLGLYGRGRHTPRAERVQSRRVAAHGVVMQHVEKLPKGTVLDVPELPTKVFTTKMRNTFDADVQRWQLQMARRGWEITVDGFFGSESSHIAKSFESEKGLLPNSPSGTVDSIVWTATWSTPVS